MILNNYSSASPQGLWRSHTANPLHDMPIRGLPIIHFASLGADDEDEQDLLGPQAIRKCGSLNFIVAVLGCPGRPSCMPSA